MTAHELKQIYDWADNGTTLDGFWERVIIASMAYPLRTQIDVAQLAALCLGGKNSGSVPQHTDPGQGGD